MLASVSGSFGSLSGNNEAEVNSIVGFMPAASEISNHMDYLEMERLYYDGLRVLEQRWK